MGNTKNKDYKTLLKLYQTQRDLREESKTPSSNTYYKLAFKPRNKFKSPELNRFLNWYCGYLVRFTPHNKYSFVQSEWEFDKIKDNKQYTFKDLSNSESYYWNREVKKAFRSYLNKFQLEEIPIKLRKHFKAIYSNNIESNWVNNDPFTGIKEYKNVKKLTHYELNHKIFVNLGTNLSKYIETVYVPVISKGWTYNYKGWPYITNWEESEIEDQIQQLQNTGVNTYDSGWKRDGSIQSHRRLIKQQLSVNNYDEDRFLRIEKFRYGYT